MSRFWLGAVALGLTIAAFLGVDLWILPPTADSQAGKKGGDKKAAEKKARDVAQERALLKETAQVDSSRVKELEKVVQWAATSGLKAEAAKHYEILSKLDPDNKGLPKLKAAIEKAPPPKDEAKVPELQKTLAKKLEAANEADAKKLFGLAKRCMTFGLFTRAYDLVNQVAVADPDHKEARKILGYAWDATSKTWISQWELDMRKTHFVTDEGWVKKADKAKWDKGLREYQTKWVSKEEEARIRKRNSYSMFAAASEHFQVESNLGRKQAYEFALDLEDFYREFFRFFLGYYDQAEGAKLFFAPPKTRKKHRVLVFPSREDYLTYVKAEKGNDELLVRSAGVYIPSDSCAYLYRSDSLEQTYSTLYHEITHQLLEETKEFTRSQAGKMWVVEGMATYMETWLKDHGKWKPGANVSIHEMLGIAAFLAGEKSTDWSIRSYVGLGHEDFHKEAERPFNYAMGCALSHFFLHGQDEAYREGFVRFVKAFYEGAAGGEDVLDYIDVENAVATTEKNTVLTKQLREHMASLGSKQARRPGAGSAKAGEDDDK